MGIKVAKFGGSSLANSEQFNKARQIVAADADRRYVVPSAPGKRFAEDQKITDLLFLCHASAAQKVSFDETFELIRDRYLNIVEELSLAIDLYPLLDEIHRDISRGATADYAASRGEFLNAHMMASLLGYDFVDAAEIVFFNSRGMFDAAKTHQAVSARLARNPKAVVPGYYGSMPDGSIKTFSRGGSDITGAIVARGVGAEVYENWTDVPGLLMADPRIVKEPKPIELVTYQELRELAYMGANVLHDEAIFPVRQAGIPVHIRNTNDTDAAGTRIVADAGPPKGKGSITGIAGRKDFTVIAVEKALMNAEIGFGRRMLTVLEANEVSFEHMPSGIDTMSLVVADREVEDKLDTLLDEIRHEVHPDALDVYPNMALIATVGRGMAHMPGMAAKLFGALAAAGINIRMIDQGSSELNIIVGIEANDFDQAIRAIYHTFVD